MKKRLLVVDDEAHVRQHIQLLLDDMPYELYEASNGAEAHELLHRQDVDVLITDIRMPKMDGLELIRRSLVDFPQLSSIVLSNFAEFNLAQQAIRYGAKEYLLKATLTKEELLEGIDKALKWREENKRQRSFDPTERITIINALFHERLSSRISTTELIRRAKKHDIPLFSGQLAPLHYALVQVNRFVVWVNEKYGGQMDLAVFAMENMISESMRAAQPEHEIFHLSEGKFIVVGSNPSDEHVRASFERLQQELARYVQVQIGVIYGYVSASLDELFTSVQRHLGDYDELFYSPYGSLYAKDQLTGHQGPEDIDFYEYFTGLLRNEEGLVKIEQLPIWIESFLDLLVKVKRRPDYIKEDLSLLITFIEKSGFSVDQAFQKEVQQLKADHMNDYKELFKKWLHSHRFFSSYNTELTRAIQYIHEHYTEKITLDDVCSAVNLSRSHFSKIFKEEVGMTLTEYIETVRMNQARMLLRTTTFTIGEISEMIGISDIFYFSKMYKRKYRVSPSKDR